MTITSTRHESDARIQVPAAGDLGARIERIARDLPQFSLVEAGPSSATLSRRTNLFTWGETITIRWTPAGEVHIHTDTKHRTAFGDYGQGRRDITVLAAELSRV